mmetsp:Transcript_15680/g.25776  ORF Transcript_15680/g.25776 Transcript_15680/m.25776 type:complete len:403 (+) Transcript_15680:138-1346(+)
MSRNREIIVIAKKRDVVDAILSSTPERLKSLIDDQGYDINSRLSTESVLSFNSNTVNSKTFDPGKQEIAALCSRYPDCCAYPLHLAIIALYHSAIKENTYSTSRKYCIDQSLETIRVLLHKGADWKLGCKGTMILNTNDYKWFEFPFEMGRNQPIHLAIFLKKYEIEGSNEYMDKAVQLIQRQDAWKKAIELEKKAKAKPTSLETTAVLKCVANTYNSMLFSENFSDVAFLCSDGVSVPAHKFILAASSPYFETAFQGDWAENNAEGIWKTSRSSSLIKSVLTLLYTGSVEECEKLLRDNQNDPLGLLEIACEYDIKPLVQVSVDNCIKNLKLDNVRMMLQSAQLYSCDKLKKACFECIKTDTSKALMSPDLIGLATENPNLWAELGTFLEGKRKKRPRTDM